MKNFFKGISWTQICAGALAAVTSFLLSAKIGVAGSVIGVAVGSIVSAVASQIYQNVLKESGKKLQAAAPFAGGDESDTDDTEAADDNANGNTEVAGHDAMDASSARSLTDKTMVAYLGEGDAGLSALARGEHDADGDTRVIRPDATGAQVDSSQHTADGATRAMPAVGSGRSVSSGQGSHISKSGTGVLSASERAKAQQRHKRTAIVVAVASALAAVALTAGIISLVTKGQGTDDVARNLVSNSTTRNPKQDDSQPQPQPQQERTNSGRTPNGSTDSNTQNGQSGQSDSAQNGSGTDSTQSSNSGSSNGAGGSSSSDGSSDANGSSSNGGDTSGSGNGSTGSGSGANSGSTSNGTGSGSAGSGSEAGQNGNGSSAGATGGNGGAAGTHGSGTAGGQSESVGGQ